MHLRILQNSDLENVLDLFCKCFLNDHYYRNLFKKSDDFSSTMRNEFRNSISICINTGLSIGIIDNEKLIAFALLFNFSAAKSNNPAAIKEIFGLQNDRKSPYFDKLQHKIKNLEGDILYLLSIAVDPDFQRVGLASSLVDEILNNYSNCNIVSDVSNESSLGIYKKRNFEIDLIDTEYYFILHKKEIPVYSVDFYNKIHLLVPDCKALDQYGINYSIEKECKYIIGFNKIESKGISCFTECRNNVVYGVVVLIEYKSLLEYQRLINVSQACECFAGDVVFYRHNSLYSEYPLFNSVLSEMIKIRQKEWSLIPDVFVSVPVQYLDMKYIENASQKGSLNLLENMDFRTHYEAGVPSVMERVDDLASFKRRIKRYYLGKEKIQIASEITANNYFEMGALIGAGTQVDIYISVDIESNCAVLTWYSLSSPFLISHLFDNIIRNQIMVANDEGYVNFYDHIQDKYGLIKRGTPKIFSVFPSDKNLLSYNELASLLVGETIYPEGENFGEIIDEDILSIVQSKYGMGQYDRAFVIAYKNTVLQFSENLRGSLAERIYEESITLFYIELILFEEAAIHIANREIIKLFTSKEETEPIKFLSKVDAIYDSYSKTIDFWNIRVNYPTSQKSISMIRQAFEIKEQLDEMQRNLDQLKTVFETKCDIIDRKNTKRMDTSLAILSVFAIFSAWIDGYDYIGTWNDVLPQSVVHILQRILFVLILITAGYAVTHLFGNKIKIQRKNKKTKGK